MQIRKLENKDIKEYKDTLKTYIEQLMTPYTNKEVSSEVKRIYTNMCKFIEDGTAIILGAIEEGKLLGFIWGYKKAEEQKVVHVNYFFINEKYRSKGIGKQLLQELESSIKDCNEIELLVNKSNIGAFKFYKRNGFEIKEEDNESDDLKLYKVIFLETPYYIINKKELEENFSKLDNAIKTQWNNYIIGYSYKTNSLPWIVRYFDKKGCFSEVVSNDEYELGKLLGVEKNKFIYNGPIKTKETFLEAANNGNYINIDSNKELQWATELKGNYKLGLRVNFDIEKFCPNESQCGAEGGRFGFCYENGEFAKALEFLKNNNVKIAGLHLHVSSKTRSIKIYKAIATVASKLKDEYNLELNYLDIGGGFFGGLPNKPKFDEYIKAVAEILINNNITPKETTLIVEPGMAVIGAPINYVSSVIDVKDTTYNRFVITDGTRTSIDPLMKKNQYFHTYKYAKKNRNTINKQVICGYTCMENDRLYTEEDGLELKVGDKIIYEKVGAYTMCLTPLFIKYFPDVYVLDENNKILKVRNAWTSRQYIQNSN